MMYIKQTTSAAAAPSSSATCGMKMEHYCHLVLILMNQLLINHISRQDNSEAEKQSLQKVLCHTKPCGFRDSLEDTDKKK